jgi:hypothetical protein
MEKLIEDLERENDIAKMEVIFRRHLYESSYTNEQLKKLRNNPKVQRYAELQYILEKVIEENNFKSSNEQAKKESFFKKIFIGIGLWP